MPLCDSFVAQCGASEKIRFYWTYRQILVHILLRNLNLGGDDPLMMIDDDLRLLMMI